MNRIGVEKMIVCLKDTERLGSEWKKGMVYYDVSENTENLLLEYSDEFKRK